MMKAPEEENWVRIDEGNESTDRYITVACIGQQHGIGITLLENVATEGKKAN